MNRRSNQLFNFIRSFWIASLLLVGFTGCRWGAVGQNTVGVQLYQQGRLAEALQQFEAAKLTDPKNPDTYYNLASTYHRMGVAQKDPKLIEQAESLYNQCLDMAPNHAACHRGLAVMLVESNRSDKAFTLLKKWASENPQLSDPQIELAKLHQEFNQTSVAEQMLDEVLGRDPNNAVAWSARGQLREKNGDIAQARQNYLQSLSLNAAQPEVYQRLAAVDLRLGQQAYQNSVAAAQNSVAAAQSSIASAQNTLSAAQSTIANSTGPGTPAPAASTPSGSTAPIPSPRF
jgi:tetratricopeptide (TPR) repeat protein